MQPISGTVLLNIMLNIVCKCKSLGFVCKKNHYHYYPICLQTYVHFNINTFNIHVFVNAAASLEGLKMTTLPLCSGPAWRYRRSQ